MERLHQIGERSGGTGLLDEVTGLVEWPVILIGSIDAAFMELPPEVLTTSMREHQKYFALENPDGTLAAKFALAANRETADGGKAVVAGNERVLRARGVRHASELEHGPGRRAPRGGRGWLRSRADR